MSYTGDFTTGGAGWKCARCGCWIPANTPHTCPSVPDSQSEQEGYTWLSATPSIDEERLYRKLDRIIELLEMLANIRY